jgi:hypothetical protein
MVEIILLVCIVGQSALLPCFVHGFGADEDGTGIVLAFSTLSVVGTFVMVPLGIIGGILWFIKSQKRTTETT